MILTTGVGSGLGQYLHEKFGGRGLTRSNRSRIILELRRTGLDTIIHCAANGSRGITHEKLPSYLDDNLFLTQELLTIPHRRFIFFSTIDLYPKNGLTHHEDEVIDAAQIQGIYAVAKFASEASIRRSAKDFLILRPTTMIGPYARPNGPLRILRDQEKALTLSAESSFNCIHYEQIAFFLHDALEKNISGIYNLASSRSLTLREIVSLAGRAIEFGAHRYEVGNIDTHKVNSFVDCFHRTTRDVLLAFMKDRAV